MRSEKKHYFNGMTSTDGRSITRGKRYFIEVSGDQELAGKGRPQSKDATEISVRVGLQLGWANSGDMKIKIKNEEETNKRFKVFFGQAQTNWWEYSKIKSESDTE